MTYYMPTKVYEEENCVAAHAKELAALGTKAMLVTGKHSAKANGAQADVIAALEQQGLSYVVFDEVEENPSIETVMKARDVAVSEDVDFFIGIGGGSPMDAAKAISLMAYEKDADSSYLYETHPEASWYPVVCVPTTCGTGSEVTGISVLTVHEKQTKSSIPYLIFPELALVDAKYVALAPDHVLLNTAMDALCHLTESYLNVRATDYSRMCADAGLQVWSRCVDALLEIGAGGRPASDSFVYSDLMRASTLAGMAIAQTGTALPHGLSYGLTYSLGIPHGQACGQFLAGYLNAAKNAGLAAPDHILKFAGLYSIDGLKTFFETTCGRVAFSDEFAGTLVEQLASNPSKLKAAPFPVDRDTLIKIVSE